MVAAAAASAGDVSILVNNAGSSTGASLLTGDLADIRLEIDTHFFGTLAVTRAFAPQLGAHESSAVLNILSVLSWVCFPAAGAYAAGKTAAWSMTNTLRRELAPQGTSVTALRVGDVDTDMSRDVPDAKADPADVARTAIDGLASGAAEISFDDFTAGVKAGLSTGVAALYPQFARPDRRVVWPRDGKGMQNLRPKGDGGPEGWLAPCSIPSEGLTVLPRIVTWHPTLPIVVSVTATFDPWRFP